MLLELISNVTRHGQLLLSGLILLLTVATSSAGEKIRITGPETIAPPGYKEDIFTNPSDFLKSKPDSAPILAPPPPSISIRPDKLQDDKKWDPSEKFDEEGMLKKALGVRDYSLESLGKKPKGNWEKLYAETAERKGQMPIRRFTEESLSRDDNDFELFRRFATDRGGKRSADDDSNTSTPMMELNFFNLLFGNELGDNFALIAGGVVRGPFLPKANNSAWNRPLGAPQGDRNPEQKTKSKQFDSLFDSRKLLADPINGRSDDARREMNPVTGRKVDDFSSANGNAKPTDTFGAASSMRSGLSGPLDGLNSRVSGVSSLAPSATPIPPPSVGPSSTPIFQEIPRRKF